MHTGGWTGGRWPGWILLGLGLLSGCAEEGATPQPAPLPPLVDAALEPLEPVDMARAVVGGVGAPCAEAADCQSGFCVRAPDGASICAGLCAADGDCPAGWGCSRITNTGADTTFVCLPDEGPCAGRDLDSDPEHCGACMTPCRFPGAEARCEAGTCTLGPCLPGFFDLDGDAQTGCEYACTVTRGGIEACDSIDNDCDGAVDEGFELASDPAHCGACGQRCALPDAIPACVEGRCVIAACAEGRVDADGRAENGCEAGACAPVAERCDGVDNDCDGAVDEDFDLAVDMSHCGACDAPCALPAAEAACVEGECRLATCRPGFVDLDGAAENGCEYACAPDGAETCDGRDNDCDGAVDEGFDLDADPAHCGRCGRTCAFDAALPACVDGLCLLAACLPGHHDLDRDVRNGCEYACAPTGAETCDGVDNDCDGAVDEGFDLRSDPAHCGACGQHCAFANAGALCVAGQCRLDACDPGFVDADGLPANGCECAPEGAERCDGIDNDCDGRVDEGFDLSGDPDHCGACGQACVFAQAEALCSRGVCRLGACAEGFVDADGDPETGCECAPLPETCDGADNDCDGRVDEDFDLDFDGQHCGGCGLSCLRDNAWTRCDVGTCVLRFCDPGFVDADGRLENGCELDCAAQPEAPACAPAIRYPGTYALDPPLAYTCSDLFVGDVVVRVSAARFIFSLAGGVLDVQGAPALMSQRPAPEGPDFEVRGVLPGGDLGCTETYTLRGTFVDADRFEGLFQIGFAGLACGFTTCSDRAFPVSGQRAP